MGVRALGAVGIVFLCSVGSGAALAAEKPEHLAVRGWEAFQAGDTEAGRRLTLRAFEGYRNLGSLEGEAWTLLELARQTQFSGDHAQALAYTEQAIDVAQRLPDKSTLGRGLCWSGWILNEMGRFGAALVVLQQANALGRTINNPVVIGLSHQEMGTAYLRLAQYDAAEKELKQSIGIARRIGVGAGITEGNTFLAEIRMKRGQYQEAHALLIEARDVAAKMKYWQASSQAEEALGRHAHETNAPMMAARHFTTALRLAEKSGYQKGKAAALLGLSLLESDPQRAYEQTLDALEIYAAIHDHEEGWAMTRLGAALIDLDKPADAEFVLDQALDQVRRVFQHEKAGLVFTEKAYVATLEGEDHAAVAALQRALDSFRKDGSPARIWPVEDELGRRYEELGNKGLALHHYEAALATLQSLPATPGYPDMIAARRASQLSLARKIASLYGQMGDGIGGRPPGR